jgi:glycosyltransferase involved in cell wall biosynthesis
MTTQKNACIITNNDYLEFLNSLNYEANTFFTKIESQRQHPDSKLKGWNGIKSLLVIANTNETYEVDIRFAWNSRIFSQDLIDYYESNLSIRSQVLENKNSIKKIIVYLCSENVCISEPQISTVDKRFIVSDRWKSIHHIYLSLDYTHPFTFDVYQTKSLDLLENEDLVLNPAQNLLCKEGGLRLSKTNKKRKINHPLISVITVVRNGERYIEQTIQSIINQSYDNIEYIILDGCSSDRTLEIIQKYANKIDYWLSASDNGLSDVMNRGVELATGQYISHLHSDDFFLNHDLVESVVNKIIINPSVWYTGLNLSVDFNGNILDLTVPEKYRFKDMMVADIIKHPGTFIERHKFLAIKFSSSYRYAMDYFFFLNLWRKFGDPVVLNDIDVVFRIHQNSLSSNYLRSLSSEMKARLDFRRQEKEYLFIPSDIVIYLLRVLKTFIYHYPLVYLNKLKFAKQE